MSTRTKAAARRKTRRDATEQVHPGGENVFADLGLPDADERLAKAELARQIALLIRAAGLTQTQAAKRLGVDQPKVSALLRGRLKDFSTERLMRFITALDRDVEIAVREPRDRGRAAVRVVA